MWRGRVEGGGVYGARGYSVWGVGSGWVVGLASNGLLVKMLAMFCLKGEL